MLPALLFPLFVSAALAGCVEIGANTMIVRDSKALGVVIAACLALAGLPASGCADATDFSVHMCGSDDEFATALQPVIYGEASWVSVGEAAELLTAAQLEAVGAEVAILRSDDLEGAGGATLSETSLMCAGEPMADEVAMAGCSGVRVAPDLVVTAAHCTLTVPCEEMVVTGGYDEPVAAGETWSLDGRRCGRVLVTDDALDVAVIELSEAGVPGLSVARPRLHEVSGPTSVILASHPLGTSTKVDLDARVRPSARGAGHLWFRGDSFKGSSGAGVFDARGRLVGLVTAGISDFNYDRDAQCMRVVRSDSEGFERVASVISVLRAACTASSKYPYCDELSQPPPAKPAPTPPHEDEKCRY